MYHSIHNSGAKSGITRAGTVAVAVKATQIVKTRIGSATAVDRRSGDEGACGQSGGGAGGTPVYGG